MVCRRNHITSHNTAAQKIALDKPTWPRFLENELILLAAAERACPCGARLWLVCALIDVFFEAWWVQYGHVGGVCVCVCVFLGPSSKSTTRDLLAVICVPPPLERLGDNLFLRVIIEASMRKAGILVTPRAARVVGVSFL